MSGLVQLIQEIAQRVLNMDRPAEIRYGLVLEITPKLKIALDQQTVPLEGDMILQASVPAVSLAKGDRLILLQNRKGQQYYILGKR